MPRASKPKLALITPQPLPSSTPPPDHLDDVGAQLWREVTATFTFDDPGSYEVLAQACSARSRAARCAAQIDQDGEMIQTRTGPRSHPLLRDEIANRALCCRCLARLGLDLQPTRSVLGRPPKGGDGLSWQQMQNLRDGA